MNLTRAENQNPGTADWQLTNPVTVADRDAEQRTRAIEGFASATSVNLGSDIAFFVSTTDPTFSLEIFRMGWYARLGGRRMISFPSLPGIDQPTPAIQTLNGDLLECDWQPTHLGGSGTGSFQVPANWVSGVYIAKLTADSSGKQSYIIFVVRDDDRPSNYLFQSSVTTYQAYNGWGGKACYPYNSIGGLVAKKVSFNRPYFASSILIAASGNGAGHFFMRDTDGNLPPPAGGPDITFADAWEYNMIRWLESQGYDMTYCTNIDVHRDPNLLVSHNAFLSVGHDEYWSRDMRLNVEHARDTGINLAFFSGNSVFSMIRLENDANGTPFRTLVHNDDQIFKTFPPSYAGEFLKIGWDEESLVGGTWIGGAYNRDMQISGDPPLWMLKDTGLSPGSQLGDHIAGYEVNHILDPTACPPGMKIVAESGVPSQAIWYTSQKSGAGIFSAATIQWSWSLDDFVVGGSSNVDPPRAVRLSTAVQQLTANILSRFLDSTRMVSDLVDGEYQITAVKSQQALICDQNGARDSSVIVFGDASWHSANSQAVWIIKKYTGGHLDSLGPYKAAEDTNWYTIRNKENGQHLIVGHNGIPDGPVIVIGDQNGFWGESPSNLVKLWRIWRYTGNDLGWYLVQNVACGQLLIVGHNGVTDGPVMVFGDNGGWGEEEENESKMWALMKLSK